MKRSRRFLYFPLLLLSLVAPFTAATAHAQSLLWEISGKGLGRPSYIYGTIHAACPGDIHVSDSMLALLESCDRLVMELDLADERLRASMGMIAFMPGDTTLHDLLSDAEYEKLSNWFRDSLDMSLERMDGIRPMFYVGLVMKKAMNCRMTSYEEVFVNAMERVNKEVDGIETPDEQLEAFSQIPLRAQAEAVLEMIDSLDAFRRQLLDIQRIYDSGDIDALYDTVRNSLIDYGSYQDKLLLERNRRWIPRLEREIRTGPVFIAVGAGHLAGEDGVLALLRREGYRVTPVFLPDSARTK